MGKRNLEKYKNENFSNCFALKNFHNDKNKIETEFKTTE